MTNPLGKHIKVMKKWKSKATNQGDQLLPQITMVKPSFSLLSLACLVGAFALPQAAEAPEKASIRFEPGPGLPTLEELGLTIDDLLKPIPEETLANITAEYAAMDSSEGSSLVKRYDPVCHSGYVNINDARGCYNYLNALGTTACTVHDSGSVWGSTTRMCVFGQAQVKGQCFPPNCPATSWCQHVAHGVAWTIANCNVNGQVAGALRFCLAHHTPGAE
ncbi:hypothetical protein CC2G_013569 [Coprinopsis cinerea AmutBmut pab1-1]|nr:hypothetical protein CC2G_013569 [Coprinopsis cinerea AmutBmut pab1-1]